MAAISATSAKTAERLLTVDEALERILSGVPSLATEELGLLDALGSVLAADARADHDVPPFTNSAMDGYAVRGEDVTIAPAQLRVVGDIARRSIDAAAGPPHVLGVRPPTGTTVVGQLERRSAILAAAAVDAEHLVEQMLRPALVRGPATAG